MVSSCSCCLSEDRDSQGGMHYRISLSLKRKINITLPLKMWAMWKKPFCVYYENKETDGSISDLKSTQSWKENKQIKVTSRSISKYWPMRYRIRIKRNKNLTKNIDIPHIEKECPLTKLVATWNSTPFEGEKFGDVDTVYRRFLHRWSAQ